MNFEQALMYFGTARSIAQALRVSPGRVSQCKAAGGFSYPMQCVLEKASGGALQAFEFDAPSTNGFRNLIWPELAVHTDKEPANSPPLPSLSPPTFSSSGRGALSQRAMVEAAA